LKHTVPVITDALVLVFFYSTWLQAVAYQKQLFRPKLTGSGLARGASKNLVRYPLFISSTTDASNLQPLTLATSNLV